MNLSSMDRTASTGVAWLIGTSLLGTAPTVTMADVATYQQEPRTSKTETLDVRSFMDQHFSYSTAITTSAIGNNELAEALYDIYTQITSPIELEREVIEALPDDYWDLYA